MALIVDNINIKTTTAGYLIDSNQWSRNVAVTIANAHDIELTTLHWNIIELLRDYCTKQEPVPSMRIFAKLVKNNIGVEQAKSIELMRLFGSSPAAMAARIAGLPKPKNCL